MPIYIGFATIRPRWPQFGQPQIHILAGPYMAIARNAASLAPQCGSEGARHSHGDDSILGDMSGMDWDLISATRKCQGFP